ncbi:MAG: outer membrane protein assembly factor BamD, partial [Acidobacteria bacterium]|nr:outer membrane protein assembly factor BamD [Acidobacteriota bacterium]
MTRRFLSVAVLSGTLALFAGCTNKKVQNPIANVNSKQPDKVLFDRAMDAMKHNKYDVARMTLQTLINTYPDSEFVARAKLAVGDSWYAEGGSAGLAQAEIEYKDFITFFPNMPEAAEAQLKVANIHYRQMEKADRDFTHAKRAEDEYRQLLLQFPDSKLVPEAKQRLLEVQEVLAEREFRIGRFYYMRESYPAAIARLKSLTDAYPLYSQADDALFLLGDSYERMIERVRASRASEAQKGALIRGLEKDAGNAYSKIITRYPVMDRAADAKRRLEALHQPVPKPTPEAIAQNKAEQESRTSTGMMGRMMLNFHRHPDVSIATKVGDPTLVDPKQTSATDVAQQVSAAVRKGSGSGAGENSVAGEIIGTGAPRPNEPAPRSENPPGAAAPEEPTSTGAVSAGSTNAQPSAPSASGPVNSSSGNE